MKNNVPAGIFIANAQACKSQIDKGYSFIAVGIDTMIIGSALDNLCKELK